MNGDQSCLNMTVNRLESDNHSFDASHSGKDAPSLPTAASTRSSRQFFRLDRTVNDERVWLTSFNMECGAQEWYYCLEQNHIAPMWPDFADKVQQAFGLSARSNPRGILMRPRRTETVEEYKAQFWTLAEQDQIDLFTGGLRNPL